MDKENDQSEKKKWRKSGKGEDGEWSANLKAISNEYWKNLEDKKIIREMVFMWK